MSVKSVLIGTISGIVAGAVVGLLLAPASGEETRNKLCDSSDRLKWMLKRLGNKTGAELEELASIFAKEISGLGEDAREKVLKLINESRSTVENVKRDVKAEAKV